MFICLYTYISSTVRWNTKKNCHYPPTHQYVPLHTPTILLLLCFQVIKRQLDTYGSPAAALAIDTYGSPPKTDPCTLEVRSFIHNGDFLTNFIWSWFFPRPLPPVKYIKVKNIMFKEYICCCLGKIGNTNTEIQLIQLLNWFKNSI